MPVLEVKELTAGYGNYRVLFGASFNVEREEIVAVVGPNGSGKSTLLKAIAGLARVFEGSVRLEGGDITRLPAHERARLGLAYLPQVDNVFPRLTVKENLVMAGYMLRSDELHKRIENVLDFLPQVRALLHRKVWSLSGGERQIVAIAMALVRSPRVIMLDEPTASLAPGIASQILSKIRELRDEYSVGIVLVEQNARRALEISDRALLLVAGRQAFWGPPDELLSQRDIIKTYLGVS